MRSYQIKRKNNIIIGTLCAVVLLMVVGYAAFSSLLNIKGTSGISSNWDIEITNIRGGNPWGGDAYDISEPTYTPTIATFNTGLKTPSESDRMYEVEVTNKGTLEGLVTIASLSCGDNEAIGCYVDVANEKDYDENWESADKSDNYKSEYLDEGQQDYSDIAFTLAPGEKHYIYVDVWYRDVENQPDNLSASIKLELTYEQAVDDGNGNKVPNSPIEVTNIKGNDIVIKTRGDGLHRDEYEEGRYVYKGSNVDNYIQFNNELWRILAFEADGTVKIIKNSNIDEERFEGMSSEEQTNIMNWNQPSTINNYLNGEYYISIDEKNKKIIVNHNYGIGAIDDINSSLIEQIQAEKSVMWNGKFALINISDFINAGNNNCKINMSEEEKLKCSQTNWMISLIAALPEYSYYSPSIWTLDTIEDFDHYNNLYYISSEAAIVNTRYPVLKHSNVVPVTHLKSDIILKGSGTQTDPYVIVE